MAASALALALRDAGCARSSGRGNEGLRYPGSERDTAHHETAAFEYACPTTLRRSGGAARRARRRRQGDRRRPEPDADAGVSPRRSRRCWSICASCRASTRSTIGDDGVRLGALVRWRDIEDDAAARDARIRCCEAAIAHVAHYQIRNRGTVGGSLAHADPAAEMPGVAVTCDAEIAVVGAGRRARHRGRRFFPRRR